MSGKTLYFKSLLETQTNKFTYDIAPRKNQKFVYNAVVNDSNTILQQ